jgi:hypothetical protein
MSRKPYLHRQGLASKQDPVTTRAAPPVPSEAADVPRSEETELRLERSRPSLGLPIEVRIEPNMNRQSFRSELSLTCTYPPSHDSAHAAANELVQVSKAVVAIESSTFKTQILCDFDCEIAAAPTSQNLN